MTAPVPAATSGRNRRSQSAPPFFSAATRPVNSSAAATGVSKSAPMVAATASEADSCAGTLGMNRAMAATTNATLIAMIGFSGPRLTPPASESMVTIASPGRLRSGCGGSANSVVAESGPP